jgi:3-deoxy-D-manno-octulosonate 8-phosphate phosphatase (KDO 8-P phosphatase)
MAFFKEELMNVKGFVFDVDGVLSRIIQPLTPEGDPARTANIRDGFAMVHAIRTGYPLAIITGGNTTEVRKRYQKLGVTHLYMGSLDKITFFDDFLKKTGLKDSEIMYMGDDLPDYLVMKRVGVPVCPNDAVTEIKSVSKYISDRNGGEGCVRDVVEQVLRAQGKWIDPEKLHWSSF